MNVMVIAKAPWFPSGSPAKSARSPRSVVKYLSALSGNLLCVSRFNICREYLRLTSETASCGIYKTKAMLIAVNPEIALLIGGAALLGLALTFWPKNGLLALLARGRLNTQRVLLEDVWHFADVYGISATALFGRVARAKAE